MAALTPQSIDENQQLINTNQKFMFDNFDFTKDITPSNVDVFFNDGNFEFRTATNLIAKLNNLSQLYQGIFLDMNVSMTDEQRETLKKITDKCQSRLNTLLRNSSETLKEIDQYKGTFINTSDNKLKKSGPNNFFEYLTGFSIPPGTKIRNIVERKQPSSVTGQCFGSYNNVLPEDKQLGQTNYDSLTWSNGSEMRCYICDVELNNENEKRNMQCEHFFALTEAMLFWRLHSDTQLKPIANLDIINKMTVREYGPVCRKCNCEPYKSSLRIFKFNESKGGPVVILDEGSLKRIADGGEDPPVLHHDGSVHLNFDQRKSRLKKVFTPLVNSININLAGKNNEKILDILIKDIFHIITKQLSKS